MPLVVFRSKAAGEIYMFPETVQRIFEILGRDVAPRGVITVADLDACLQRLVDAVAQEKSGRQAPGAAASSDDDDAAQPAGERAVSLGQRAYPLIEMLRAAIRTRSDVTWGV